MNKAIYLMVVEVHNSNPNGSIDEDNHPRINPYTALGMMSPYCQGRTARDYGESRFGWNLNVKRNGVKNRQVDHLKEVLGKGHSAEDFFKLACSTYQDVRLFGEAFASVSTVQVRRTICFSEAESVVPLNVLEHSLSCVSVTNEQEVVRQLKEGQEDNKTIGHRYLVPHALYRSAVVLDAIQAERNGVTDTDIKQVEEAMLRGWEDCTSVQKNQMRTAFMVKLDLGSKYGNAFLDVFDAQELLRITPKVEEPKNIHDYEFQFAGNDVPLGVEITWLKGQKFVS